MHGRLFSGGDGLESRIGRVLAGRIAGVLFLTGAVSVLATLVLPGPAFSRPWVVAAAAALAVAWGATAFFLVDWEHAPRLWWHMPAVGGLAVIGPVAWASGGVSSPAHNFLVFVVAYAALFYPARTVIPYIAGCALVLALPITYDGSAIDAGLLHALLTMVPAYVVVGGTILLGRTALSRANRKHMRLAAEQASLRKIATMVASGSPPHAMFAVVASEIRRLLGSDAAGVVKFEGPDTATVLASTATGERPYCAGTRLDFEGKPELGHVRATGRPCRIDEKPGEGELYASRVCVPFFVEGHLWGGLCLGALETGALSEDAEERLLDFAELLAVAIANAEDRERLVYEAGRDLLTGVGNHRCFDARLREEVGRERRHGAQLTLAVVDIDRFRELNERAGHDAADRALVEVARLLGEVTRSEDTIARVTGDEFAVIMPGTDKRTAMVVTERVRQLVAATVFPNATRLTISAGICDLETAADADSLVRYANGALYWAKTQGRDSSWIYDPTIVRSLSAQERADYLERSQGLVGLRALARAIDAKDATTRRHSERVAAFTEILAAELGWSTKRIGRLREAALVHDVGKIGIPDAILLKPSRLSPEEYEIVKEHAALSAQIVEGVLSPEQVEWIAAHHERPDGLGYPAGLEGGEIPDGAAILALADSWDVMTAARLYSDPKDPADALAECWALVGNQFTEHCVRALERLYERGELTRDRSPRGASLAV